MIRLLKRIADWLDSRFPAKVHVTEAGYHKLLCDFANLKGIFEANRVDSKELEIRVRILEKSLISLKEALVKGEMPMPRTEAQRMREAFIRDGVIPGENNVREQAKSAA